MFTEIEILCLTCHRPLRGWRGKHGRGMCYICEKVLFEGPARAWIEREESLAMAKEEQDYRKWKKRRWINMSPENVEDDIPDLDNGGDM